MIMKVSSTRTNRLGKRRNIDERGKAANILICSEEAAAVNNVFLKKVLNKQDCVFSVRLYPFIVHFLFNFVTQKTGGITIGLFLLLKSAQQQVLKAEVQCGLFSSDLFNFFLSFV